MQITRRCGNSSVVEHNLAKVGVASSSLVSRSSSRRQSIQSLFFWLGGRVVMQRPAKPCTPVRFRPQPPKCLICPGGETGRRKGLKIPRDKNPVPVRLRPWAPFLMIFNPYNLLENLLLFDIICINFCFVIME